jgi:hypothetical protein
MQQRKRVDSILIWQQKNYLHRKIRTWEALGLKWQLMRKIKNGNGYKKKEERVEQHIFRRKQWNVCESWEQHKKLHLVMSPKKGTNEGESTQWDEYIFRQVLFYGEKIRRRKKEAIVNWKWGWLAIETQQEKNEIVARKH